MGGFEVLVRTAEDNARAREEEWKKLLDEERREGIPVDLWRSLPDSPAEPG